eukprot:m.115919 g.115919  ORF g.115919 m.115919 type:complete len:70 (+) comp37571_c0_seq14:1203-1412(+)
MKYAQSGIFTERREVVQDEADLEAVNTVEYVRPKPKPYSDEFKLLAEDILRENSAGVPQSIPDALEFVI